MRVMHRLIAVVVALSACGRARATSDVEACAKAAEQVDPAAAGICKRAWDSTHDVTAAVGAARMALVAGDYEGLRAWAAQAPANVEGARILHFWGEMQRTRGELDGAEKTLRRALALRRNVDPLRASNTALALLSLVRSSHPARQSIELAYTAWDQANRANEPRGAALAAASLVEVLVDIGELEAAQQVIKQIDETASPALHALAEGRVRAAQSRNMLATSLFQKAAGVGFNSIEGSYRLDARIELVYLHLQAGRVADAAAQVTAAEAVSKEGDPVSTDMKCRLAAARASVLLAQGNVTAALAEVDRGLAIDSRDSARVLLLNVRGDALARQGDVAKAEQAWRSAADEVEAWRESIPSIHLRAGLVEYHRHALASWLESAATRGDLDATLRIVQRIVGRALLDRIRERDTDNQSSIPELDKRLAARDAIGAKLQAAAHDLSSAPHDLTMIVSGSKSVWSVHRTDARWSVSRVGARQQLVTLVDAYRRDPDDAIVASQLGEAMFPDRTIPRAGPLVVVLDRDFSDVALAGLRSGNRYLVERVPILELLVPNLIFHDLWNGAWGPAVAFGDPLGDLAGARREVSRVASTLGIMAATGPRATKSVITGAAKAHTLHIATHSSTEHGLATFVTNDGALSSYDIVNQHIAPRLAVIATCRSQINDDPEHSLVAAFLAAGASGVIGVKRAIEDADGEQLVEDFYRAHGDDDPMTALATAQRNAIQTGRPPHAWAAFSFFGTGGWLTKVR